MQVAKHHSERDRLRQRGRDGEKETEEERGEEMGRDKETEALKIYFKSLKRGC